MKWVVQLFQWWSRVNYHHGYQIGNIYSEEALFYYYET